MDDQMKVIESRTQSDEAYAQQMLDHVQAKYDKPFEIIKYIFPQEGFNTDYRENVLLVRETQSGTVTNVYALLGDPYIYYDNYVSDLASQTNQHLVSCGSLAEVGTAKLHFYLREENVSAPDTSKENVAKIVLAVNIRQAPDQATLETLYGIYQTLFALDYENTFMVVGFTEQSVAFDDYVCSYRVFGKKAWDDYGETYATLTAKDAGLSFEAFQALCKHK